MPPFRALVVGGGIAGPAFAHWLSRVADGAAHVTLIERSPAMRASGQQVDVRGPGVEMLARMGIEPAVRARRVREPGVQLVDVNGRVRALFPAVESGTGRQSFSSEYEIMRGAMVEILYDLTRGRPNVRHVFGTTVAGLEQDEEAGKVNVRFKSGDGAGGVGGSEEAFDLVVGADGTGSHTRRMMLGPGAPDPRHRKGGYLAFFSAPAEPDDPREFTVCTLPGRVPRVIAMRKDAPELARVYMTLSEADAAVDAAYASGDRTALKAALADLFDEGGGHWKCARFTEALRRAPEADDLYCTPVEEVRLPRGGWSRGRVVLLGDAAHSATADGYGTSHALVGAYVLAGELARRVLARPGPTTAAAQGAAIAQAARAYEEAWRPIATATHGDRSWFDAATSPRSKLGISLFHAAAATAAFLRVDRMAGLTSATSKWQLPKYPELESGVE